jgi:MFS family permease
LAFNYVDRQALGVLLQGIKIDLNLSDTQLGLITGLAFAAFYSLMGIPLARWADRGNRITLISVTVALWSVMVMLCGSARGFLGLAAIRVGVAIGEAGCVPPAHSLIADYFSRADRPRAMARYMLGGPLSSLVGYWGGGWLNQRVGWRTTFVLLGLPGLVLAVLSRFTLVEPRQPASRTRLETYSWSDAWRILSGNRTFRHLVAALSVLAFFSLGSAIWQPTFFMRHFGLSSERVGLWMAVVYGLGGLVGIYLGGEWAARWAPRNERRQLAVTALIQCIFAVATTLMYFSHTYAGALGWLGFAVLGAAATSGPLFATVQSLVPGHLRASAVAVIFLFSNLIGLGLGPLLVGMLSDALRARVGDDSLRVALMLTTPGYLWAACHLWQASRSVSRDLSGEQ